MKKVLLLLALMPFLFTSCGSDDNEDEPENKIDIIGIWKETSPYDKSFMSLANDGSYKIFASRNNSDVGFILDAGYYSINDFTINFQSSITGNYKDYVFTTLQDGKISMPLENGTNYTFKKDGKENNALTNQFIGKTYKCSEGGYIWVGGTDYGTIEFNNGYQLTYTVTTVVNSITRKETKQTYNYLYFNNKFYIQQPLGFYICTYSIKNDVMTITDAEGKKIFK